MPTLTQIARDAATRFNIDHDTALQALTGYLAQADQLAGTIHNPDDLDADTAAFLMGALVAGSATVNATIGVAEELAATARELADQENKVEEITARRDQLIVKAAGMGIPRAKIAETANISRARIQQILANNK